MRRPTHATPDGPGSSLEPVPRPSDAEIARIRATFAHVEPFVARDPYRPLEPGAERVDFYAPVFVRGRG